MTWLEINRQKAEQERQTAHLVIAGYLKARAEWEETRARVIAAEEQWLEKAWARASDPRRRAADRGQACANVALRRARKLQATPAWVDRAALTTIYAQCPAGYVVDHIVPLVNPLVCGLHVPWNLQYLTREENGRKWNKFPWPA